MQLLYALFYHHTKNNRVSSIEEIRNWPKVAITGLKKKEDGGRAGRRGLDQGAPGGLEQPPERHAVRLRARNMRLRSQVASRVLVARSARKK
jgi:hypothetical protein